MILLRSNIVNEVDLVDKVVVPFIRCAWTLLSTVLANVRLNRVLAIGSRKFKVVKHNSLFVTPVGVLYLKTP